MKLIESSEHNVIDNIKNILPDYAVKIMDAKQNLFKWKGFDLVKDPMTLTIYMQLIQDIKPKTIIELGTGHGGSALFYRDICKALNLSTRILTFDCESVDELPGVEFIKHDLNNLDTLNFDECVSPMLVFEDCHVNMLGVAEKFSEVLNENDYLVIEDTIDSQKYKIFNSINWKAFDFVRDDYYCDFWGRNNSWNYDSILRKV